jgi:hypothetical protein
VSKGASSWTMTDSDMIKKDFRVLDDEEEEE